MMRSSWEKEKRTRFDLDYKGNGHFSITHGAWNDILQTSRSFSRLGQVAKVALFDDLPGQGSEIEVSFEEPDVDVVYEVEGVYDDKLHPIYKNRDKYVLHCSPVEVADGEADIEEAPDPLDVGYRTDTWEVQEYEEPTAVVDNWMLAYDGL